MYLILLYSMVVLLAVNVILCVWVAWCFKEQKFPVVWPIKVRAVSQGGPPVACKQQVGGSGCAACWCSRQHAKGCSRGPPRRCTRPRSTPCSVRHSGVARGQFTAAPRRNSRLLVYSSGACLSTDSDATCPPWRPDACRGVCRIQSVLTSCHLAHALSQVLRAFSSVFFHAFDVASLNLLQVRGRGKWGQWEAGISVHGCSGTCRGGAVTWG